MSEAGVHFDFYRHLQNAIDDTPQRSTRTYERVEPEYNQDIDGRADLVVFDTNEPVLVIEAKRPDGGSGRDIDPYSPIVIRQAHGYASELGAPFFATYNGGRLVLFNTHEEGVPLLERSTKSYDIGNVEAFADTLLSEISRLETGSTDWDSLDDAFIKRVRSLHEQLTPEMEVALSEQLDRDEFRESFVEWAGAQGLEYNEMDEDRQREVRERFAEEGAYLLANKLLFYKILEDAPAYSGEVRPLAIRENHARDDLEEYFEEVVANVDFEAVFEHDDVYSELPLARVGQRINEFIEELDEQDLTQFDSDVIGRIYEGVIPPERRHDLGEYYTPPAICDLITRLTVREASDEVLDPACGSGGFPVSAYHRKRDLLAESTGSHDRLLQEIYGIDINRFPAHLTAINLAIQDLGSHTDNVNIEVSDFFNVNPDTARFGRTAASASGTEYEHDVTEPLGNFDAIVGNPPYIRQENIGDKEQVREHLDRVDGEGLSRRSDIYSYFLTHATEFLRDGGQLGFITSDRWLDTKYGVDLQEFILDNYKIRAVIKFETQAFDDALIGSTVIILSKEEDEVQRNRNVAKFLRVNGSMEVDNITSLVEDELSPEKLVRAENYRMVTRTQQDLYSVEKWNTLFSAPPIYYDLLSQSEVVELDEVANISYGKKSGANAFFYANTEDFRELGLEEYAVPLLKATGQVEKIRFTETEAKEWACLDFHELIQQIESESNGFAGELGHREEQVKDWLSENGHEELIEYISWGEQKGYHERSSSASRDIWFDLGELPRPSMLHTQFTWREHRVIWNEAQATATNQFHCIAAHNDVPEKALAGILNSRVAWLVKELLSRRTPGQGMTRIQTMVYETEQLIVADPRQMSSDEQNQIISAFENLMQAEDNSDLEAESFTRESERDELDQAVLTAIGLEDKLDELKTAVQTMVEARERGAGENTRVLVDRPDEGEEVIDLAGVSDTRESTTLGDFD